MATGRNARERLYAVDEGCTVRIDQGYVVCGLHCSYRSRLCCSCCRCSPCVSWVEDVLKTGGSSR
jgi:hypothetical protein